MFIVVAVVGDDCSENADREGPTLDFDPGRCDQLEGDALLDPREVARSLRQLSEGIMHIEVALVYGGSGELPPRLAAFVDELGVLGHLYRVSSPEQAEHAAERVAALSRALTYRSVCIEGSSDVPSRCEVFARMSQNDDVTEVVPVDREALSMSLSAPGCEGPSLHIDTSYAISSDGDFDDFVYTCF